MDNLGIHNLSQNVQEYHYKSRHHNFDLPRYDANLTSDQLHVSMFDLDRMVRWLFQCYQNKRNHKQRHQS